MQQIRPSCVNFSRKKREKNTQKSRGFHAFRVSNQMGTTLMDGFHNPQMRGFLRAPAGHVWSRDDGPLLSAIRSIRGFNRIDGLSVKQDSHPSQLKNVKVLPKEGERNNQNQGG
jgi:hypothetical protein